MKTACNFLRASSGADAQNAQAARTLAHQADSQTRFIQREGVAHWLSKANTTVIRITK
jgi:hypothetical protein